MSSHKSPSSGADGKGEPRESNQQREWERGTGGAGQRMLLGNTGSMKSSIKESPSSQGLSQGREWIGENGGKMRKGDNHSLLAT